VFRHSTSSIGGKGKRWSYRKKGSYGTSTISRKIKELRGYEELGCEKGLKLSQGRGRRDENNTFGRLGLAGRNFWVGAMIYLRYWSREQLRLEDDRADGIWVETRGYLVVLSWEYRNWRPRARGTG
jgi:hypothetical protein